MAKDLKKILSESAGLSESTQEQISEAWELKLQEARDEITSNLREEFAKKFEHDKSVMVESIDSFLTDKIRVELEEFAQDKRSLAEERIAYKHKISEHTDLLNKFITEMVAKEVKELRSDRSAQQKNMVQLENFLLKQLSEEIQEFRSDKKALVEQKVKMVAEGKKHLRDTKNEFIKRASKVVESNINTALKTEIGQFKADIKEARENDFGRRIFESFVGEYITSYLSEGTEVAKLNKALELKESELTSMKVKQAKGSKVVEGLERKLNAANDNVIRQKQMTQLLAPLSKDKKGVMSELLETVQTKDLAKAYNKYLPALLNETKAVNSRPSKRKLSESKMTEKTGNRATQSIQESQDELAQLKALAGLK